MNLGRPISRRLEVNRSQYVPIIGAALMVEIFVPA